jgi:hypothetical protein
LLRTGSIGNRDADSFFNTLIEPKKTILGELRSKLLDSGYDELADYDTINIEPYVSYSFSGKLRFIFKHKWELAVMLVLSSPTERESLANQFQELKRIAFETNEDGSIVGKLDPKGDKQLILSLGRSLSAGHPMA